VASVETEVASEGENLEATEEEADMETVADSGIMMEKKEPSVEV